MKFTYAFFVIGLCYRIGGVYSNHIQYWRRNEKYDDRIFANQFNITKEPMQTKSVISCARLCTNLRESVAFSYRKMNCFCYDSKTTDNNSYTLLRGAEYYTKEQVSKDVVCRDKEYIYLGGIDLCFKVFTARITSTAASEKCRLDGGHLITVDTAEKFQALSGFLKKDEFYWIGLKMDSSLEWKWANGKLVNLNTIMWYPGEPNGLYASPPEDCGGYLYRENIFGLPEIIYGIIDNHCTAALQYICEL